jgi:hypothetical protein
MKDWEVEHSYTLRQECQLRWDQDDEWLAHPSMPEIPETLDDPLPRAYIGRVFIVPGWSDYTTTPEMPEDATWWDLFREINIAMLAGGDHHHVFVEGFSGTSDNEWYVVLGS